MRELGARFEHCLRRNREGVAHRDRLIEVVERRGCARRTEAARPSRIVGTDVVEAVANAQLILAADLMVDLAEHVGGVHRDRVHAGDNPCPL